MRVNQLVVVVPVPGPGMDDAAVRTEVWQQVSAFLLQYLGKRYVRFEPATLAWNQKVEQPFGVILGRSDPALFLYLYAMGKKFQDEAIQFHLDGFLKNMEVDQTLEHGRVLFCSIERNGYRSMPETPQARRLLAKLVGSSHDLLGIPGFYTRDAQWTVAGPNGFLIPVRNQDGLIQGLKIRLDDADKPGRKYRWLSSRDRHLENGTRSYSWIHVTGDRSRKRAFLTEGPLKGDVASFLANDALFICTGGVNAIKGLRETILELGVTEIVEAMDMDQMTNPQVRNAILTMRREVQKIPGVRYSKYTWNPAYKGVDDYFLSRVAAM